jgi:hypothetical protein
MLQATLVTACLLAVWIMAQDPKKTADLITGHDKSNPTALNPQCKLFTESEAAKYIGESVAKPRNATGGCQWPAKDDTGDMMVTVLSADYHLVPSGAKAFRNLANVGEKGYICREFDGWAAGAIHGKNTIKVTVAGDGASEQQAIALLKETVKRVK